MKKLFMLAFAVSALLTVSACKKAADTDQPAPAQEATEQATEAAETAAAAVEAPV